MLDMANDSGLFRRRVQLEEQGWHLQGNVFHKDSERYMPLYEAKMSEAFNHRAASVVLSKTAVTRQGQASKSNLEKLSDPRFTPVPRSWINEKDIKKALPQNWSYLWLLGWRDITSPTNERTLMANFIPLAGVGDTFLLMFPKVSPIKSVACLCSLLNSFVLDYCARQKLGGIHMKYHVFKQLAVLPSTRLRGFEEYIVERVLELTFTSWDMQFFAQDCGYKGPPFRWDEDRRFKILCELDAVNFHLYEIDRDDVDYVMETFPIVKRKDEQKYGEFRTKRVILECYDAMAAAIKSGQSYQTILDPPPADPRVAHLPKDSVRPPGETYELLDLLNVNIPGEIIPVRLPEDMQVDGCDPNGVVSFRFCTEKSEKPSEKEIVIIRHPELRQGKNQLSIAAGEVINIQDQYDPVEKSNVVLLVLKNSGGMVKLKLPEEEWESFRPLSILER